MRARDTSPVIAPGRFVCSTPTTFIGEAGPSRRPSGDVVDTRVFVRYSSSNSGSLRRSGRYERNRRKSSSSSSSSTTSEWVDTKNANRYKEKFICKHCGRNCRQANHLARHLKYNCSKNPQSEYNNSLKKLPFQCECGRRFTKRKGLNFHVRHECQKSVTCEICNISLVGSTVQRRHLTRCAQKQRFNRACLKQQPMNAGSQSISSSSPVHSN